jgi:predicted nucleic acid-binding protein
MMSILLVILILGGAMATKNSLFVDTSGWAYLVDRHDPLHSDVHAVYRHTLTQQRLLVTTNYVLAELVALLSSRSRIPRQQIFMFVDALRVAPHVEIIHISADFGAQAWTFLKARVDKNWSLVDASSFIIMTTYGMTEALTTDHHFTQAGFVRLPAR